MSEATVAATLYSLAGSELLQISPLPADVKELKLAIEEKLGMPYALQKLVKVGDCEQYSDEHVLPAGESFDATLLQDESPLWTWDSQGNPNSDIFICEDNGHTVKCPDLPCDYVNVITKEPIRKGMHYFEFVMHYIGDEQSCGLVADPQQAGCRHGLRDLKAWSYYPGRMGRDSGSIRDGKGALHANGKAVKEFAKLMKEGDVIGMLADMEKGAVAFSLNGELQGACEIPKCPLWVLTHLDTRQDCVELRKPCLDDAPPANLEALQGALLDISKGMRLDYGYDSD